MDAARRRTTFRHLVAFQTAVFDDRGLTTSQRIVLLALARYARFRLGYGSAWPSVASLAQSTGLSRASVHRALGCLEGGWVRSLEWSEAVDQQSTSVRFLVRPGLESPDAKVVKRLLRSRPGYAHEWPAGGLTVRRGGLTQDRGVSQ